MREDILTAGRLNARLDRIPVWALPNLFAFIIGIGFLFTFYDIFDINVSFIQTCMALVPGCTAESSANYLGLPVLLGLIGYVIGTLFLSPLADRMGRRDLLLITMVITGIGSALTGVVDSYNWFVVGRVLTGIGVGADLAIVNTYITEMAPIGGRARYTSLIFIFSSLGAVLGIWMGLLLTTPPAPFPLGLPFAVAGAGFDYGWRVMYLFGGLLALMGILLRFQLPESPRWLITKGRLAEADEVITYMEQRAHEKTTLPPVSEPEPNPSPAEQAMPYSAIFRNRMYRNRSLLLLTIWFFGYVTVYSFAAGLTTLLSALRYPPPEAGLITAMGTFGFVLCAVVAYAFGESMERKLWALLAAVITLVGSTMIALAGTELRFAIVGAMVLFFGFNVWMPIMYTRSAEYYPTRARTTGFALVDGLGHIGGGLGLFVIAPLVSQMSVLTAMLLFSSFLVIAAVLSQFGLNSRGRLLEEISP